MAIPGAGQFVYEVALSRSGLRSWSGRASTSVAPSGHPGLVGDRPEINLNGGVITLRCTEALLSRVLRAPYRRWGPPATEVTVRVGGALEAVSEEGDLLRIARGGTTDLGAALFRHGEVIIAFGAVAGWRLGSGITVQEDPRAFETSLYYLREVLKRPEVRLVWLDASDPHSEAAVQSLGDATSPGTYVIAITGKDPDERRRLNNRVGGRQLNFDANYHYADIDGRRFTTQQQWMEYLQQLPTSRPSDLHIHFDLHGVTADVQEREHVFLKPWHLFVQKVYREGLPGEASHLAIAREHSALTREALQESTALMASGYVDITR